MYDFTIVRENPETRVLASFASHSLNINFNTRISSGMRGMNREGTRMCMPCCMS